METKQTAVEWLQEKVIVSGFLIPQKFIEQAKQMEKEQIIDAFDEGFKFDIYNGGGEKYYNETYGK